MKFFSLDIEGLSIIDSHLFEDDRGSFMEIFRQDVFDENEPPKKFVQDNLVTSKKNVIRGLHFQDKFPQGKLIRCIKGSIYDVAVDLRKNSETFGNHVGFQLSEENKLSFWIPEGFAHGYSVLSDDAIVLYKCTDVWHQGDEGGVIWNDETLNIDWGVENPIISEKDKNLPKFTDIIK